MMYAYQNLILTIFNIENQNQVYGLCRLNYNKKGSVCMTNANMEVIADLLIQLGTAIKQNVKVEYIVENNLGSTNTKEYLTRKQVLEMYSPVITDYGLRQSMNMDNFPYIRRGKQYFFVKDEIDKWLVERNVSLPIKTKTIKYV